LNSNVKIELPSSFHQQYVPLTQSITQHRT
jgi:hypothetical protein